MMITNVTKCHKKKKKNPRAGSMVAEVHIVQRSATFCRVSH